MAATEGGVHPSDAVIEAFGQGRLSPAQAARLEAHLAKCQRCGERLGRVAADTYCDLLRGGGTTDAYLPPAQTEAAGEADDLPRELRSHPRYEVQGRVGAGGMGVVYRARHRVMNRLVALKVIRPDLTSTPIAVGRFRREVQAAARLSHANVVTAFDAEEVAGVHFLVMEYVDGVSLETLVQRGGTLSPQKACGLIRQAAAGLGHAHGQGMIHRDVKPGNLMAAGDVVKILDFGLACWSEPQLLRASPGLTQQGARLGTVAYAAPEQLRSAGDVDSRADQYGLGATLYFLLVGKHPPPASPSRPPRRLPLELPATLPEGLRRAVERMMALDAAGRFASVAEAADALRPWCAEPTRRPSRRALLVGAGCAAAALFAGAAAWKWGRRGTAEPAVGDPPLSEPRNRPVLFLLPSRGLWLPDYTPVRDALERAGRRVVVATPTGRPSEPHPGSKGSPVPADVDLGAALAAPGYDAVVCVGYRHDEFTTPGAPPAAQAARLLRRADEQGGWLVGICAGQRVLGAAGFLRGRRVARQGENVGDLAALGALPQPGQRVVVDGRVLTATGPEDAADAGAELVRRLA